MTDEAQGLLVAQKGAMGRVTLNRPQALNALTHPMALELDETLAVWADDPTVDYVLVDGAGERGLCAGGDIRSIYLDARSGGSETLRFWADEYRLNARIARFPKPYVVVMDGLVMGGGVGISAHGSVRVVTERSKIGLPEVGIGLVPDVGATYLLSRAPGELGTHIALTGGSVGAQDAIHCGLADMFVPAARLQELARAVESGRLDGIDALSEPTFDGTLATQAEWIDSCYAADSVEEILERLHDGGPEARKAASQITSKSPSAVKVALRSLRAARVLPDLETVLEQEYRVSRACFEAPDLVEGIRAQIIDKDRSPQWSPSTLAEVSDAAVDAYLAPRSGADLELPRFALSKESR